MHYNDHDAYPIHTSMPFHPVQKSILRLLFTFGIADIIKQNISVLYIPVISIPREFLSALCILPYLITCDQRFAIRINIKSDSLTRFARPG